MGYMHNSMYGSMFYEYLWNSQSIMFISLSGGKNACSSAGSFFTPKNHTSFLNNQNIKMSFKICLICFYLGFLRFKKIQVIVEKILRILAGDGLVTWLSQYSDFSDHSRKSTNFDMRYRTTCACNGHYLYVIVHCVKRAVFINFELGHMCFGLHARAEI